MTGRRHPAEEWNDLPTAELIGLDRWIESTNVELRHLGWFGAGRSGDLVGLVEVYGEGPGTQHLVMKFCSRDGDRKAEAIRSAYALSPKPFRKTHLVDMVDDPIPLDRWWLLRQRVAGGDLTAVRPLTELMGRKDFPRWGESIVKSLLGGWNPRPPPPQRLTVQAFLERILRERIAPRGPILTSIAELGVPLGVPTVEVEGRRHAVDHPLVLLQEPRVAGYILESVQLGRAHGDVSGRNILVPTDPKVQASSYFLIDNDRFETAAPLARDPMHLLVALALDRLGEYRPEASLRRDLIEAIVDPAAAQRTPADGFTAISAALREGSAKWAKRSGLGQPWRQQSLLALVAAALMHVGRDLPGPHQLEDRRWCFDLAAAATEAFLDLVHRPDRYSPRRHETGFVAAVSSAAHATTYPSTTRERPAPGDSERCDRPTRSVLDAVADDLLSGQMVLVVGDALESTTGYDRKGIDAFLRSVGQAGVRDRKLREHLVGHLRGNLGSVPDIYSELAALPFRSVVLTFPNLPCERAFLSSYRPIVIDNDLVVRDLSADKRELFLIGGSVVFNRGLVVTQRDRELVRERYTHLGRGLRDRLAMSPVLFLGCDFEDWRVKRLVVDLTVHRTSRDGAYYVCGDVQPEPSLLGHTIEVSTTPQVLVDRLSETRSVRRPRRLDTETGAVLTCSGFRYLDYYDTTDSTIFFGRIDETRALAEAVRSSPRRLSILCGRSGAGKTSLVRAGLLAKLDQSGESENLYVQCDADPILAFEHALAELCQLPSYSLIKDHHFEVLRANLPEREKPLLFVFDQVEEAFVRGGRPVMTDFLRIVRHLSASDWFPARFLLVIREDFLAEIAAISPATGVTLDEVLPLLDLDRAAAAAVIAGTADAMGWRCEPGFVDAVLDDLSPDRVLAAHLQIVCHRVQASESSDRNFSVDKYAQLGRASRILGDHVRAALGNTDGTDIKAVKAVLGAMVTGRDTKRILTAEQISKQTALSVNDLNSILQYLVHRCRLIREVAGRETRFELAHESLIESISEWLDIEDKQLRTARDLLEQEVVTSRRRDHYVISDHILALVEGVGDQLHLDQEGLALVACAFSMRGHMPEFVQLALAASPPAFLLDCLLIRPALAEVGQFEAVLRSPVSALLPDFSLSDLPDELVATAKRAIGASDPGVVLGLLRKLRVDRRLAPKVLRRLVAMEHFGPDRWVSEVPADTIRQCAQVAGSVLGSRPSDHQLGLKMLLFHIDDNGCSPAQARETIARFFRDAQMRCRGSDACRAVASFLSDSRRPLHPAAFAAALEVLANLRSEDPPGAVTNHMALFLRQVLDECSPDQAVLVSSFLLFNLGLPRQPLGRPPAPGATLVGRILLRSLDRAADRTDLLLDRRFDTTSEIEDIVAVISWACSLPRAKVSPSDVDRSFLQLQMREDAVGKALAELMDKWRSEARDEPPEPATTRLHALPLEALPGPGFSELMAIEQHLDGRGEPDEVIEVLAALTGTSLDEWELQMGTDNGDRFDHSGPPWQESDDLLGIEE